MGDIAFKKDDVQKAKEYYEESLEIRRENVSKYPSYLSSRALAFVYEQMGHIAIKENDLEKAKEWYLKCLDICRENVEKFPSYESICDISTVYLDVAKTEKALSNNKEAVDLLNNALHYATKALRIYACDESIENFTEIQKELASLQ